MHKIVHKTFQRHSIFINRQHTYTTVAKMCVMRTTHMLAYAYNSKYLGFMRTEVWTEFKVHWCLAMFSAGSTDPKSCKGHIYQRKREEMSTLHWASSVTQHTQPFRLCAQETHTEKRETEVISNHSDSSVCQKADRHYQMIKQISTVEMPVCWL